MYLSNLKLWNFRKFGNDDRFDLDFPDLDLPFTTGLNVLIGENDSGKSAIIDAIRFTIKTQSYEWFRITSDDFYNNSERFRIELRFDDLTDNEAKFFTEWIGWTDSSGAKKPFIRLIYDVSRKLDTNRILPSDVRIGLDEDGYPIPAEARELLKSTYLKPLRDAHTELVPKKYSRLSQILQGHYAFTKQDSPHYLLELFQEFNQSIEGYFQGVNSDNQQIPDQRGKELKNEIDGFIKEFYDQSKEVEFSVIEGKLQSILEKLDIYIKGILNPGLGTQNRLFMASELLHLSKPNWDGLRLGLIEELEAHLHPQAQMQVVESLQQHDNIQLILTTHSPNLASKIKLKNIILCTESQAFPLGNDFTKLDTKDYQFLEIFLDTTKANLFFAKGVILVEGWSEELIITPLAKKLKQLKIIEKDLTEAGVSIVNVGSTAFLRYSKIFLRKNPPNINIPVSIITDVDIPEYKKVIKFDDNGQPKKDNNGKQIYDIEKREESIIRTEIKEKIEELTNKYEDQNIKVFLAPNWTLDYCIWKSTSFSQLHKEIVKEVHSQIDMENYEKSLASKLISQSLKKSDIAYCFAKKLTEDFTKENPDINIDLDDNSIKYLIEGIKYACGN